MEPIALSDDDSSASDVIDLGEESNDDVIEICDVQDYYQNNGQYDHIVKESALLGEFIEKCLDLENTSGMVRVINRSLLPAYYSTTETFRKSDILKTILTRSICKLDSDPDHKFSHIKDLCIKMKIQSRKLELKERRQEILSQSQPKKRRRRRKAHQRPFYTRNRQDNIENIVLSDDDDDNSVRFEVPVINLDEHNSVATITGGPLKNNYLVQQVDEHIEVEIDSVNKVTELENTNETTATKDCAIPATTLNTENLNSIKGANRNNDVVTKLNSNEAHLNSKINQPYSGTHNFSQSLLQEENLELLKKLSNTNESICDNEVSSTEISSTVPEIDDCARGSQDSDLIILDEVTEDAKTTSQEANEEMNVINSNSNSDLIVLDDVEKEKITSHKERNFAKLNSNISVDDECNKSCQDSVTDLIVVDEENKVVTTTQDLTQEIPKVNSNCVKENKERNNELIVIGDDDVITISHITPNNNTINLVDSIFISDENKLLVPHKTEAFEGLTEDMLMIRISKLEADIAAYKNKVTELEEREVDNDSMWSPYIQCEKYKEKIVNLYKELCKLTGERAIKRREVRLKAANARSQLCVDKLENLINSNIGPDGLPHFPDYQEVLQCVSQANKEADLGWNRNEVMREANALFTYCGRALQQSRKRREWRDMLSLVKSEAIEDPADNDPELLARLQANKQTAVKKENDLLNRYTEMTYLSSSTECTKENDIYESGSENDTENDDEEDIFTTHDDTVKNVTSHNNKEIDQNPDQFKTMEVLAQKLVDAVCNKPSVPVKQDVIRKRCTPIRLDDGKSSEHVNERPEIPPEKDPMNILNHNFELIPKVVLQKLDLPTAKNPDVKCYIAAVRKEVSNLDTVVEIKKEPLVDIQEELNNLGTDFIATVIDIQDPFLIIEISSDEDEDDDFTGNARHVL